MELLGDVGRVESCFSSSETVLVLEHDRCTVCAENTIGSEIVLDAPGGTLVDEARKSFCTHRMELPGDVGLVESHFDLFEDRVSVGAR
jgi:hypothetical protein